MESGSGAAMNTSPGKEDQGTQMAVFLQNLGSLKLSVWVFGLLTLDLLVGYICVEGRVPLFQAMNSVGLVRWLQTYGQSNPVLTAWLVVLIPFWPCLPVTPVSVPG